MRSWSQHVEVCITKPWLAFPCCPPHQRASPHQAPQAGKAKPWEGKAPQIHAGGEFQESVFRSVLEHRKGYKPISQILGCTLSSLSHSQGNPHM